MFDRSKWILQQQNDDEVKKLVAGLRISPICAKLLINRGYCNPDSAKIFLNKTDTELYNPFLLADIGKAVGRIRKAIENEEKVTIYGDYDVDGVTSVSILYMYLRDRGVTVDFYIPTRENEGYGLNIAAFDTIKEKGTRLVITVDTGITAIDEIKYANQMGLDVVVTDHHQCRDDFLRQSRL